MEDPSLKPGEAFALLNGLRSAMLTLCNMYITGVGVFVVAATTLDDKIVVLALTIVTAVFMIGNYVGFFYNFRSQTSIYIFLRNTVDKDGAAYRLVEDGRPLRWPVFSIIYTAVSLTVLAWAAFYFQAAPKIEPAVPAQIEKKH